MLQAKRYYGNKLGGINLLNLHQRLSAYSVLGLASAAQISLLWQLGHIKLSSFLLISLLLLSCFLVAHKRQNITQHKGHTKPAMSYQRSSSSLFVLAVGGFGMLLGSTLDSIILSKALCITSEQLPVGLVYNHFHGFEGLASYMVLLMMLFCLPSCIVFCSPSQNDKKEFLPEICKHAFAAGCMLLGMLYLPHVTQNLLNALSNQLNYTAQFKQLLSPLIVQHCLMLVSMLIGSLLGYQLFAYLQRHYNANFKQI